MPFYGGNFSTTFAQYLRKSTILELVFLHFLLFYESRITAFSCEMVIVIYLKAVNIVL